VYLQLYRYRVFLDHTCFLLAIEIFSYSNTGKLQLYNYFNITIKRNGSDNVADTVTNSSPHCA